MSLSSTFRSMALAMILLLVAVADAHAQDEALTSLSGQTELARLVDLCALRLGVAIEYDAADLTGKVTTLRLDEPLSDQALWALTNRLLTSHGFVSIRLPGPAGEEMMSIVKLTEAPGLARVEDAETERLPAGFVTVVVRARNRPTDELIEAVKPMLSKPGGTATALGDSGLILLADLRPRIDRLLKLLELIDAPVSDTVIERIPVINMNATQLSGLITSAAMTRDNAGAGRHRGKVSPAPDGSAIILVTPPGEIPFWRSLIAQFDRRAEVHTETYIPIHFDVVEVARLVEQAGHDSGPQSSGDRWKLVVDELTGSLIITATATEHDQIRTLLERLDSAPSNARRTVRAFPIRNRSVSEVADVLSRLIDVGVFDTGESPRQMPEPGSRQQSRVELPVQVTPRQTGNATASSGAAPGSAPDARSQGSSGLTLTADEGTNTLIAIGEPRLIAQIEELITTLDIRQAQVVIEVLVVTLNDTETLDLGVELEKIEISGDTIVRLSSLFGLGTTSLLDPKATTEGRGFTGVALNPGDFSVVIRALETINNGRALNLPKVLVNNNEQATLDSVLQAPFLSTNASDTVATTSFGGTQDAGTTVTVQPQIAEGDHLVLSYSVSLSTFVGTSQDPSLPPPRQQNNIQSVVTIPDGYTIAVGGLEIEEESEGESKVPILGDIPILGEVFKSRTKSTSRARFYVFIRASILRQNDFEDLKYLSDRDAVAMEIDDGWPDVEPRIIR